MQQQHQNLQTTNMQTDIAPPVNRWLKRGTRSREKRRWLVHNWGC